MAGHPVAWAGAAAASINVISNGAAFFSTWARGGLDGGFLDGPAWQPPVGRTIFPSSAGDRARIGAAPSGGALRDRRSAVDGPALRDERGTRERSGEAPHPSR